MDDQAAALAGKHSGTMEEKITQMLCLSLTGNPSSVRCAAELPEPPARSLLKFWRVALQRVDPSMDHSDRENKPLMTPAYYTHPLM